MECTVFHMQSSISATNLIQFGIAVSAVNKSLCQEILECCAYDYKAEYLKIMKKRK